MKTLRLPVVLTAVFLLFCRFDQAAAEKDARPTTAELLSTAEKTVQGIQSLSASYSLTVFSTSQRFSSVGDMLHLSPFLFRSSADTTFGKMKFKQSTIYDGEFVWQMTETPLGNQVLKMPMNEQGILSRMQQPFRFSDILDPFRQSRLLPRLAQAYDLEVIGREKLDGTDTWLLSGRLKSMPSERQSVSGLPLPLLTSTRLNVRLQDAMPVRLHGYDANDVLILEYELKKLSLNPDGVNRGSFAFKPPADARVLEVPRL